MTILLSSNVTFHINLTFIKRPPVLCDPISMFPHKTDMTILLSSNVTFHINLTFIKRPPVLCDPISMFHIRQI